MMEYGVFSDEGMIEGGFFFMEPALARAASMNKDEDESVYYASEICPDHEEQPRHNCETCNYQDDSEDES
jgi:hypothetical protein